MSEMDFEINKEYEVYMGGDDVIFKLIKKGNDLIIDKNNIKIEENKKNNFNLKKYLAENKLNEGEINFIPQFGKDHQIVFHNAKDAYTKLAKSDLNFGDFENIGFVFPKMSRDTWLTIKDLFSSEDIGDMGQM